MKIDQISEKLKNFTKGFPIDQKVRVLILLGPLIFILVIYAAITYNTKLKKERVEVINSFLSSNDTILLKNYLLNQIKSSYLEYDYLIKEGDTIDSILKKFSIKKEQVDIIVKKIKKMKLTDIKVGQKISFLLKKNSSTKEIEIVNEKHLIGS